ncbi:hypothetical protein RFI_40422 [Reticulomyxa filosa]|uniref:Uncharacterized protein n=1 Tax=Reticulomyxa filosa TaxID=46433 RepID=X6L776_RETFI|nr:hypothetical protein RFI_40422 [Reticulomyxa filosa]|eukprot:ETN97108.1 hypothetical protein RFI_40422 [Reticulomyxa filosa]
MELLAQCQKYVVFFFFKKLKIYFTSDCVKERKKRKKKVTNDKEKKNDKKEKERKKEKKKRVWKLKRKKWDIIPINMENAHERTCEHHVIGAVRFIGTAELSRDVLIVVELGKWSFKQSMAVSMECDVVISLTYPTSSKTWDPCCTRQHKKPPSHVTKPSLKMVSSFQGWRKIQLSDRKIVFIRFTGTRGSAIWIVRFLEKIDFSKINSPLTLIWMSGSFEQTMEM